jgi:tripartite-type tricarboxylate transporter receptor subunit TctC
VPKSHHWNGIDVVGGHTNCVLGVGALWRDGWEEFLKFPRRQFLHLAALAIALPTVSRLAKAEAYRARPVRILVGYAAGGGVDVTARLIGQWLSDRLRQPFIVENRPGAGTNIATEAVARSPPDGYALLLATGANAVNATLYEKLNFDFIHDFAPIGSIVRVPLVMVVNPSFPAKSLLEFITYAKANSAKINVASGGVGGPDHLSGELFGVMAGLNMIHVPYRGLAPALTDLLGEQVQVIFSTVPAAIEYIKASKLRALAVTTAARSELLPDVPTVSEAVPGYEASQWYGVVAPNNTPAGIVDQLNSEINAALADANMKARFADLGCSVLPGSPADFRQLIVADTRKWAKVVRMANIKAD